MTKVRRHEVLPQYPSRNLVRPPQDPRNRSSQNPRNRVARTSKRLSRRRRLLRLVVLLVVVAGIVFAAVSIATGRTVVPVVSEQIYPIRYRDEIARVAEKYNLDPYLVAAVVHAESGYDPLAVSSVGAVGLMQLMPDTAAWVTSLDSWQGDDDPELTDPGDNLELGACYLSYLAEIFDGQTRAALAAYNAGQGTVSGWVEEAGGPDDFGLTDIRFPETREFVQRVEQYRDLYMRIHPELFAKTGDRT